MWFGKTDHPPLRALLDPVGEVRGTIVLARLGLLDVDEDGDAFGDGTCGSDDQYCLRTCLLEAIGSSAAATGQATDGDGGYEQEEEQRWDAACTLANLREAEEREGQQQTADTFEGQHPGLLGSAAYGERSSSDTACGESDLCRVERAGHSHRKPGAGQVYRSGQPCE
jgi:hypothetical protein